MILILSEADDPHVKVVTAKLEDRGEVYYCFDPARFPKDAMGTVEFGSERRELQIHGEQLDLCGIRSVWYRRPGFPQADPNVVDEAQREWVEGEAFHFLMGLWQTMDCLWVPAKPLSSIIAENKIVQLQQAARLGFPVPRTKVTNQPEQLLDLYADSGGNLVTKVVRRGGIHADGRPAAVYTQVVRRRNVPGYRSIRLAPLIIQEYIPKALELRVTVVGSRVFTAAIHSQDDRRSRHDWRRGSDFEKTRYMAYELPSHVSERCIHLVRSFGLTFGAIDLILTPDNQFVFIEINPNGQWLWIQNLTGLPIDEAIVTALIDGDVTESLSHA